MSTIVKCAAKIKGRNYVKSALDQMGYTYTEAQENEKIRTKGSYSSTSVDIRLEGHKDGSCRAIDSVGLIEDSNKEWTVTGDFYGVRDHNGQVLTSKSFTEHLFETWCRVRATEMAYSHGFVEDSVERSNDKIVLTYTQL